MPLEPKLADLPRIRGALRFYQVAAIITGVLLLLLCAEMLMKYVFGLELELGGPNGFLAFVPIDDEERTAYQRLRVARTPAAA